MKYFLINGVGLKKLLVGTKTVDLTVIHNDDPVRVLDAGNTLCDDQLGGIRDLLSKSAADPCICGSIYCTGGVKINMCKMLDTTSFKRYIKS